MEATISRRLRSSSDIRTPAFRTPANLCHDAAGHTAGHPPRPWQHLYLGDRQFSVLLRSGRLARKIEADPQPGATNTTSRRMPPTTNSASASVKADQPMLVTGSAASLVTEGSESAMNLTAPARLVKSWS